MYFRHNRIAHVTTNVTIGVRFNLRLIVEAPDDFTAQARAIMDFASSPSFISECLAQIFSLPVSNNCTRILGVHGISSSSIAHSITDCRVYSSYLPHNNFDVTAVVISKVTNLIQS